MHATAAIRVDDLRMHACLHNICNCELVILPDRLPIFERAWCLRIGTHWLVVKHAAFATFAQESFEETPEQARGLALYDY